MSAWRNSTAALFTTTAALKAAAAIIAAATGLLANGKPPRRGGQQSEEAPGRRRAGQALAPHGRRVCVERAPGGLRLVPDATMAHVSAMSAKESATSDK